MDSDLAIREQLRRQLDWEDAHVNFDAAVAGIPREMRGKQPPGLPYSPWQLVDHIRRTQWDILEFCRNTNYKPIKWPDDYWPSKAAPPTPDAWDESIREYHEDLEELKAFIMAPRIDLTARIPHGEGQTYLREFVLVADHTSHHVGQLVVVRRLLGIWKSK